MSATLWRFAAVLALLPLAISCSGSEAPGADDSSALTADYPWADGENQVMRMDIGLPADIQVLADRVKEAVTAQPEWAAMHAQINQDTAPGEALPWHENYGITEEEYARVSAAISEGAITLTERGPTRFKAVTEAGITRFETDDDLATLGTVTIDWATDTLKTPWGEVRGSQPHSLTGGEVIAPFEGRVWQMREGGAGAMRAGSKHKAVEIRALIGEREDGKLGYLHLKAISANNGVIYVNDEIILQWPR